MSNTALDLDTLEHELHMLEDPYNTPALVLGRMLMEQALRELRAPVYQEEKPLTPMQWVNWWIKSRPYIPSVQWSISALAMIAYMDQFRWAGCAGAIVRLREAEPALSTSQAPAQ